MAQVVRRHYGSSGYPCAEYVTVPVSEIVAKPAAFSMTEAAAYPTVSVAAWRYLIEAAAVQRGERVLVQGGAGGVGSVVVQLAKARGAHVIATASAANHAFLRQIGADETIDYRKTRFEDVVRDVDVVVDTVGGETLARSASVLRDGGRLVTLVGSVPAELCAAGRIVCPATPPWDVQRGLAYVAPLIDAGTLRIHIDRSFPLESVAAAVEHNRSGRTRGKVVVDMGVDQTAAVTVPLQAYLDGHATGLEKHLRRAFAPDAILVGIKDGKYRQWPGHRGRGHGGHRTRLPRHESARPHEPAQDRRRVADRRESLRRGDASREGVSPQHRTGHVRSR